MSFSARIITFLVANIFFFQNSLADPPGSRSSGSSRSSTSSSNRSTSTGRADRDQQGGSSSSSTGSRSSTSSSNRSTSTGRSDRDQQGGSRSHEMRPSTGRADRDQQGGSKSSGGSKSTSTGRADRDQQGGSSSSRSRSTGRADRDQQGGSSSSRSRSTGRADRDQQGGSSSRGLASSSDRRPTSEAITAIKSGFRRTYEATKRVASRAASSAYNLVANQHQAIVAGVRAQRETMYELSAKRVGDAYTRGVESARAYYNAVDTYYDRNQTTVRAVPTGPMQDLTRISGYVPTEAEKKLMDEIDESYRQGSMDVVLPGGITYPGTKANIFVETYKELSPSQILGYENTVVVQMKEEDFKAILKEHGVDLSKMGLDKKVPGALASVYFENMVPGGTVFLNSDIEDKEGLEETLSHEMQHQGDGAVYNEAKSVLSSPIASAKEKRLARQALEATEAVFTKRIDDVSPALKGLITNNYYAGLNEFRAYTSEIKKHSEDQYSQQIAENQNISVDEAEKIIEEIANDPVIKEINTTINNYATSLLEGAENE